MKLLRESAGDIKLVKFTIFLTPKDFGHKKDYYPELPGFIFAETYMWNASVKDDWAYPDHRDIQIPQGIKIKMVEPHAALGGQVDYYYNKKHMYYHPSAQKYLSAGQKEFVRHTMQKLVGGIEE